VAATRSDIIDREVELRTLAGLLDGPGAKLALVTGRRRVGKTYLLARVWPEKTAFVFTATQTTPEQNRRQLIEDLAAWSGEDLRPEDHPTWRSVFDLLWRVRSPQPLAVVLDEFQYLGAGEDGLAEVASAINATFERVKVERPFALVMSGSAVSTMESLASGGAPLYGRLATHLRVRPLTPYDSAGFVPGWDLRERAAGYGVLGGTPAYWAVLDPSLDLRSNVAPHLLSPQGTVRIQLETLIAQEEGLGDPAAYNAIVRAVAAGATTRPRIADSTGLKADTSLVRRLDRLVEVALLEVVENIGRGPKEPVRYRVADPALRFFHVFVTPYASLLERADPIDVYDQVVAPRLDTYLGLEFERFAAHTYDRLAATRGLPLVRRWSRWEGQDASRRSIEVDVVAPLADGGVMTGSVKFTRAPVGSQVFYDHLDALRRAADAGQRWAHEALNGGPILFLAAAGFDERFMETVRGYDGRIITWSLQDVYAPS
jgi:AAA+ ATPase superfamily predicted ATPase